MIFPTTHTKLREGFLCFAANAMLTRDSLIRCIFAPMQEALHSTPAFTSLAQTEKHARKNAFVALLRKSFAVFAQHPTPILVCSLICFASAAIIGSILYVVLVIDSVMRANSYFSSVQAIYVLHLQARAVLGAFLFIIGRGAISWITINANSDTPITAKSAIYAALKQWRPLFVSAIVYGVLMSVGIWGLSFFLREIRLDPSNFRWVRADSNSFLTALYVQTIALLPPDPGAPFSEIILMIRYQLSRSGSAYYGWSTMTLALQYMPAWIWLCGISAIVGMIVFETLLCLRTAVIVKTNNNKTLAWLPRTMALAARNFGRVLAWRWLLRVMIVAVLAAGTIVPMILHQTTLAPVVARETRTYWTYAVFTAIYTVSGSLIGMLLIALQTIFEAQMLKSID
jgi:hypothetical protein